MPQSREVWISHEASISIWEEDGVGGYLTPALRDECYAQDVSFGEVVEIRREGQPGATVKDVLVTPDGFEISIKAFYDRKSEQLAPFRANLFKKYRIRIHNVNETYSGVAPYENDDHVFRDAGIAGWSITFQDNDVEVIQLSFQAERME